MRRILTRDDILAAHDLPAEEVPVPEWQPDGVVLVRALSAAEWIEIGQQTMRADGAGGDDKMLDLMIKIPALCIVNERGELLFADADLEALGRKSPLPLKRVMDTVQRLSDLDQADAKKA